VNYYDIDYQIYRDHFNFKFTIISTQTKMSTVDSYSACHSNTNKHAGS
jgi:hypothetical protein